MLRESRIASPEIGSRTAAQAKVRVIVFAQLNDFLFADHSDAILQNIQDSRP
jgi:hypothetical protein